MAQKSYNHKLNFRIAEETQLLAEEKWIVESIAKIKKERNCLQIERLHLESLKAKLKCGPENCNTSPSPSPQPSISATQQAANMNSIANTITDEFPVTELESSCNYEELDLSVTKSVFSHMNPEENMEEYEEEEIDTDDIVIDMNMLMNGNERKPEEDSRIFSYK